MVIALVVAGCSRPMPPLAAEVVFFESDHGIAVADGHGGVLSTDATVASPDWSRLYATQGTELITVDAAVNRELARVAVPGGLTARVASGSGTRVALTEGGLARQPATYRPAGKERTTIVVADPSGQRPATELRLDGNFEPEAFSTEDTYLYVLEYLPANAPERYRVRRVELASGQVEPLLLRDKTVVPSGAEEEMRGEGRQAVLSPDRTRLYTLYLHQEDHLHTRDLLPGRRGADGRAVHAFVHVLSLTEGWAYCLDLPEPFGSHPAGTHALTISPDGRTLYIAEMDTQQVAVADTESLTITRVVGIPDERANGQGAAMSVAPDGTTLYIGSTNVVRRLDAATLRQDQVWIQRAPVRGLTVSRDGRQVFVGQADRIARVDASTGQVLDTFAAASLVTLRATTG